MTSQNLIDDIIANIIAEITAVIELKFKVSWCSNQRPAYHVATSGHKHIWLCQDSKACVIDVIKFAKWDCGDVLLGTISNDAMNYPNILIRISDPQYLTKIKEFFAKE